MTGEENNLRICNEYSADDSYPETLNGWRVFNSYAKPAIFQIYDKTEIVNERYEKVLKNHPRWKGPKRKLFTKDALKKR